MLGNERVWIRRAAIALVLGGVLVLAGARPAAAHAELLSTDPPQSAVLASSPREAAIHFDEAVTAEPGSMEVLGLDGRRVDDGRAHHPGKDGATVVLSLPPGLTRGTYVVAWRVISDDGHPVHGAFIFSVATAADAGRAASVVAALRASHGSGAVGVVYGIVRFATFAGLLVLIGLGTCVLALHPHGWQSPRLRRILWGSWTILVAATIVAVGVQGVYGAALPMGRALSPSLLDDTVKTRFGEVQLLRLGLLLGIMPLLRGPNPLGPGQSRWRAVLAASVGLGLLLTPGLAGHASTIGNGFVGEALDVVHLGAASVWTGGLVLLAALLIPVPVASARSDVALLARRFSPIAVGAVVAVAVTGILQSARQVGSWYALVHTGYGDILVVKIVLVVALIGVAGGTGRIVLGRWPWGARHGRRPVELGHRLLRYLPRQVVLEIALLVAVLGAASLLVNAVPARQAAAQPFTTSFELPGVELNAVVTPAAVGSLNLVHFYALGPLGQPVPVQELDASISLPGSRLRPRSIPLKVAGPGHYQAARVDIPVAGSWELTVTLRLPGSGVRTLSASAVMTVH